MSWGCAQLERWFHAAPLSTAIADLDSVIETCVFFVYSDYIMLEGRFYKLSTRLLRIPTQCPGFLAITDWYQARERP